MEHLTLTGTSTINGTGNALNNQLTGNAMANTLNGQDGSDTITGGLGADNLTGSGVTISSGSAQSAIPGWVAETAM